jgi:DNA-binding NarL/FixJ family response regulator
VDNALRYTQVAGSVRVLLKEDGSRIKLTVEDNGIGISPEQKENIFSPYRQVSSEKRNVQGIGIGLTIVKKIVDEVKGEIVLESELNKGTRFTIILLKCEGRVNGNAPKIEWSKPIEYNLTPAKERSMEEEKSTILIVEDNHDMLSCLMNELGDTYNIIGVASGREALAKLRHPKKPDAIVSDIMMDDIDGFALFERVSADEALNCIPFIFLTAKTTPSDKVKGLKGGAVDFIYKPFLMEELRLKLHSLINIQTRQRNTYKKEIAEKISSLFRDGSSDSNGNDRLSLMEKKIDESAMSPKEKNIVKLLLRGYEYKEISHMLKISINTLKPYINKIYKKYGVHKLVDLINLIQDNTNSASQ